MKLKNKSDKQEMLDDIFYRHTHTKEFLETQKRIKEDKNYYKDVYVKDIKDRLSLIRDALSEMKVEDKSLKSRIKHTRIFTLIKRLSDKVINFIS